MNNYIVIQMVVISETLVGNNNTIEMQNIVRNVTAETKEAAIGKFVISTKYTFKDAKKKCDIECYSLEQLATI